MIDANAENADFDTMFGYACAGTVVLLCLIAIVYLVVGGFRQFSYRKKAVGNQTSLSVKANRDLFRIGVVAKFNDEEIAFERRRIKKNQSVEFVYPRSDQKAKLTVEAESGHARVYEV